MTDLVVKAAVKNELDEMNVAADFYDALDEEGAELLDDAARVRRRTTAKPSSPAICRKAITQIETTLKFDFSLD